MHSKTQLDGDPHLSLCTCRDPIAVPQTLHRNQLSAVSIVHFLRSGIRCGMAKKHGPVPLVQMPHPLRSVPTSALPFRRGPTESRPANFSPPGTKSHRKLARGAVRPGSRMGGHQLQPPG